jgi:hypothetical protein
MSDEVLVKVEGVSKKFCRLLQRSLWYGVAERGQRNARAVGALGRDGFGTAISRPQAAIVQGCTGAAKAMDGRERPPTSTENAWD